MGTVKTLDKAIIFFIQYQYYTSLLSLTLTGNIATEDRSVFMFSRDTDRGAESIA